MKNGFSKKNLPSARDCDSEHPMIRINYSITCLLHLQCRWTWWRGGSTWAMPRLRFVRGNMSEILISRSRLPHKRKRKDEKWCYFFSASPRSPPPSLDHTQEHLPQLPPAQGGSNGAPRPALCALLSALRKSAENSGQKTHFNPHSWHPSRPPTAPNPPPAPRAQTCLLCSA